MKTALLSVSLTLVLGIMSSALAIRYAPAKNLEVKSPNGTYTLKVKAKSGLHEVYKGKKVLWSFTRDVWHNDYFISNNGQRVLWAANANHHVRSEKFAVMVYTPKGVIFKKTVDQISIPKPSRIGGVESFWREGAAQKGDVVTIKTNGKPAYVIDLTNLPSEA